MVVIRSLAEYFRLEHQYGYALPRYILSYYVGGGLIAVVATGICVVFYFFRQHRSVLMLVVVTIVALFIYRLKFIP